MTTVDPDQVKPGIYRHYKGRHYQLLDVAQHSETGEAMAVYRALYGEYGLWVRPLEMFLETVERNGQPQARFQFVEALQENSK